RRQADELGKARLLAEEAEARRKAEEQRAEEAERREKEAIESAQRIAEEAEARRNAEEQRAHAEEERAQKAELLAEVRQNTARRLRQGAAALVGLLLLTIGLSFAGWIQWDKASHQSVENKRLAEKYEKAAKEADQNAAESKKHAEIAKVQTKVAT